MALIPSSAPTLSPRAAVGGEEEDARFEDVSLGLTKHAPRETRDGADKNASRGAEQHRQVLGLLRHDKQRNPVILDQDASVREVASKLCAKRQSAALIVATDATGEGKLLVGICSEVDICRRLVGSGLACDVPVRDIMTKDPISVAPEEDVSVVLRMMVRHKFRHLPVVRRTSQGTDGIFGLVDITQCLYDAIHKIERLQANQKKFFRAVQRVQEVEGDLKPAESEELAQRTMKALMDAISPSVGTVVKHQSLLKLDVSASVSAAARAMKEARMTAVLIFEGLGDGIKPFCDKALDLKAHQRFVGILTCKDVMYRVVAKGLDPGATKVSECMTHNPDTVRRNSSVLDALHIMQTERYRHLPVVDDDHSSGGLDESPQLPDAKDSKVKNSSNIHSAASSSSCPLRVCGILNVLDCAVHTFANSSGTAAQVLGSVGLPPSAPQQHTRYSSVLYHPTPVHGGLPSFLSPEEASQPIPFSHQQWRDPDSLSAFSEVRSIRKESTRDSDEWEVKKPRGKWECRRNGSSQYDDDDSFHSENKQENGTLSNRRSGGNAEISPENATFRTIQNKGKNRSMYSDTERQRHLNTFETVGFRIDDSSHRAASCSKTLDQPNNKESCEGDQYIHNVGSRYGDDDASVMFPETADALAQQIGGGHTTRVHSSRDECRKSESSRNREQSNRGVHSSHNKDCLESRRLQQQQQQPHVMNLVLKIKDCRDNKVYRISDERVKTLKELHQQLQRATRRDQVELVYLDEEGDQVQLANDQAIKEARRLAFQQGWRKLDVLIVCTDSCQSSGTSFKVSRPFRDPLFVTGVLVAACAVATAVLVVATSPPTQTKGSYRRYR